MTKLVSHIFASYSHILLGKQSHFTGIKPTFYRGKTGPLSFLLVMALAKHTWQDFKQRRQQQKLQILLMQPLLRSRRREDAATADVTANVAPLARGSKLQHRSCWQSRSMRMFEAAAGFVRVDLVVDIVSPLVGIKERDPHRRPVSRLRQVAAAGSSSEAV